LTPLVIESVHSLKNFEGRVIAVSDWFNLSQERIEQFAEATEDRQWIHMDSGRAKRDSPYGSTIAHGFLTLSLLGYFIKQAIEIRGVRMAVNYGLNRVRFPAPAHADSQIRAHITLQSFERVSDVVQAVFSVLIELRGSDKPCCVAEYIVRYYP
jgi:acyl dehydratase